AADERLTVRQLSHFGMSELRTRVNDDALPFQQLQISVETNLAERDDDSYVRQRAELRFEMGQTVGDFFGRRLVAGWRAPDGRRDKRVAQLQPVVGMLRRRHVREAGAMQRGHRSEEHT